MAFVTVEDDEGRVRWTADGRVARVARHLDALLEGLDEPHAIVCEPGIYLRLRDERRFLEGFVADRGHRLAPVTRGARTVLEAAGGAHITRDGVRALHRVVAAGIASLVLAVTRDQDLWHVREALEVAHALDIMDRDGATLAAATPAVVPYAALDETVRDALGDGSGYRTDVLLAAYRAASVAASRDEYERYLGLSLAAHGPLTRTIRAWYVERNTTTTGFERESRLRWSDYRRALRTLYQRVRASSPLHGEAAA